MFIPSLKKEIEQKEGLIFSTDTLKTDDLLTSAYSFLKAYELNEQLQKNIAEVFTEEPTNENYYYSRTEIKEGKEEESGYLFNEDVFNYFNEIAPDSYYFGTSEGDGACFGWFVIGEDEF